MHAERDHGEGVPRAPPQAGCLEHGGGRHGRWGQHPSAGEGVRRRTVWQSGRKTVTRRRLQETFSECAYTELWFFYFPRIYSYIRHPSDPYFHYFSVKLTLLTSPLFAWNALGCLLYTWTCILVASFLYSQQCCFFNIPTFCSVLKTVFPYLNFQIRSLVFNGGSKPEEMVTRAINFLIDMAYQRQFNWYGRGGKKAFRPLFGDLLRGKNYTIISSIRISTHRLL